MIKFFVQLLLELILFCLLFFNVFVSKSMNVAFVVCILFVFLILNILIHRYRRPSFRGKKEALFIIAGMTIILIGAFYIIGFKTGFSTNFSVIFKNYIATSTWVLTFLTLFVTEIIRYVVLGIETQGKKRYLITSFIMILCFVLVDLSVATKTFDLTSFNQFYEFFALILVQSVSKNIFLNYVSKKYGYSPCLVYRLIMDLYIYFIPITPKINIFIEAVLLLVYPYIIYMVLRSMNEQKIIEPARKNKKYDSIISLITAIVFAIIVALVSREFEYCMIAIGSGSMSGSINKGDAVIYKKYDELEDKLQAGDVLVFQKNNMIIVHRIEKVYQENGEEVYQTKGDANQKADNWTVEKTDVLGVVKMRVLLIAWPSVLLNELF